MRAGPVPTATGAAAPVLALVASPGRTAGLGPLVAALARRVTVDSWGRAGDLASAVLATDPAAAERVRATATPVPVAVVEGDRITVPGGDVIELSRDHPVECAAWPPLAPAVRARWRQRLRLPPELVLDTLATAPEDVPTALAVAAVALVDLRHLPLALALGCPVVTDTGALAAVGGGDGDHAVVGERPDAVELAGDMARCARLSRRARDLAESRLDPERAASALLAGVGLATARSLGPLGRLDAALDRLGTGPGARPRIRAHEALTLFSPSSPAVLGGP